MDYSTNSLQPTNPIFKDTKVKVHALFSVQRILYRSALLITFIGIFVIEAIEPASEASRAAFGLAGTLLIVALLLFVSISDTVYFLRRIILNPVSKPENSNNHITRKFGFSQLILLENELQEAIGDSSIARIAEWTRKLLPIFLVVVAVDSCVLIFPAPIISVKIFAVAFLCHLGFALVFEKVIRRISELAVMMLQKYSLAPNSTNYPRSTLAYNSMPKFNPDDELPNANLNEPPTH